MQLTIYALHSRQIEFYILLSYLLIALLRDVIYFFLIFYFDFPENGDLIAKTCRSKKADVGLLISVTCI
jgi:hypothetical protein